MSKVVTNKKQMAKLVDLMESNVDIARGLCKKSSSKPRWEQFAIELNSLGPPSRDWDKWLRVWTDLKFKKKKKRAENKLKIEATGGGPNRLHNFNDLETGAMDPLEIDACLNPSEIEFELYDKVNTILAEAGSTSTTNIDVDLEEDSSSITNINESQNHTKTKTQQLTQDIQPPKLQNETSSQEEFYTEMRASVCNVKRSMQNIEEYIRKTYFLKKEILKIKMEKLELYKKNIKNKENKRKAKLQLRLNIIELEKKKNEMKKEKYMELF